MASATSVASGAGAVPSGPSGGFDDDSVIEMTREAYQFLRCRNHLLDILETRGFNVAPLVAESAQEVSLLFKDPSKISFSYFVEEANVEEGMVPRRCKVLFGHSVTRMLDDIVKIHMLTPTRASPSAATAGSEYVSEQVIPGRDEVLIITFGKLTETDIHKTILQSRTHGIQIDSIHVQNILFNPLKHELVPEYEPIPFGHPLEKQIMTNLSIKKIRQLPLIRSHDIIARLLGLRPNQMVIVKNKSPSVRNTMIRVCVDG
jgi:DNA-directed RNA polymerase subunit H (RpoH/RPB5)